MRAREATASARASALASPERHQLGELVDAGLGVRGQRRVAGRRDDDRAPQLPADADRRDHRRGDAELANHGRELAGAGRVVVDPRRAYGALHQSERRRPVEGDLRASLEGTKWRVQPPTSVPASASGSNRTTFAARPPSSRPTSSPRCRTRSTGHLRTRRTSPPGEAQPAPGPAGADPLPPGSARSRPGRSRWRRRSPFGGLYASSMQFGF